MFDKDKIRDQLDISDSIVSRSEIQNRFRNRLNKDEDPCWDGYTMVGTQEDGSPRCVPEDEVDDNYDPDKAKIRRRFRQRFNKGLRYVSDPSEVPEQYEVQEGQRGGYFYETDGGSGGSGDFEPADVEMAIRDVEPADVEMALRDEFDIDPDDFDSAGELAPRVGLVLEEVIDAQFGDAAHEQFTMGEDGDVLDDVAMDLAEDFMLQDRPLYSKLLKITAFISYLVVS